MDSPTASPQASLVDQLSGFDPLAEGANLAIYGKSVFEEATQRVVQNILKSYTGYFDIFSELLQNSLDAIDKKVHAKSKNFIPRLWIKVDIANRIIRIVDNGSGMDPKRFGSAFGRM
jgi:HSP90 family molecular chaperone